MTQLSASDLRSLAIVLDRMGEIENETGIELGGHTSGGLVLDNGDVLSVRRVSTEGRIVPDAVAEAGYQYVIEIEG